MPTPSCQLLIISRDILLRAGKDEQQAHRIFRVLANITRRGQHLLLTAPEPDKWFPTRGSSDNALASQGSLQKEISEAGGDLDGVYYVRRSRFTQDRNRLGALRDILRRYAVEPDQALLISASRPFVKAAERLDIKTARLRQDSAGIQALERLLEEMAGAD